MCRWIDSINIASSIASNTVLRCIMGTYVNNDNNHMHNVKLVCGKFVRNGFESYHS